ncbi:alpha/beta fold hydrolase [Corallococcus sp. Z5C101001]|nr:alpha/beta fold hydrolase [Corallococcus silvisoli]TSC34559.1 alpha/beta fold hydrolase [Corallococcus sp. Z5C101001]
MLAGLGPAGSHVIFHPHFDPLAADHCVIYIDLFGRGRSDVPKDLRDITFAEDVADVAAVLQQLDLGPVHLYGFSYGGLLSQALALEHTARVRSVVLANSLFSPEMWRLNHINLNREIANQCPEVWEEIQRLHKEGVRSTDPRMASLFASAARLVRFFNPDNAPRVATEPGARNVALYPVFCGEDIDFEIGGQLPAIPDFRRRLSELAVPLLVLAGRFDRALYPALQRESLAHARSAELHVLERSGSFSHVEEPDEVLRLVRAFWARIT